MNEQARKWYGIAAGIIVIFIAAAWYFAVHNKALAPSNGTAASDSSATSTTSGGTSNSPLQIGGVADTSGISAPNLNRPYTPLSTLPQSVQDNNKKLVKTAVDQLKFNPNGITYWLQLAGLRKGANDFTGAEEIWVYLTKRLPTDPIAYNNLGDLYGNYLHDYAKAVTYWTKGSELEPKNISVYLSLATVQSINMHDTAAAKATLQAGLKANPGNADLQRALDALQ
jgi:tetratricopeptide (TPR) repeat protein